MLIVPSVRGADIGCRHDLIVVWRSRQGLGAARLFRGYKTPGSVRHGLILSSDFLEYTFVVAVQNLVPRDNLHRSFVPT
jgi:hypothetical protein